MGLPSRPFLQERISNFRIHAPPSEHTKRSPSELNWVGLPKLRSFTVKSEGREDNIRYQIIDMGLKDGPGRFRLNAEYVCLDVDS